MPDRRIPKITGKFLNLQLYVFCPGDASAASGVPSMQELQILA